MRKFYISKKYLQKIMTIQGSPLTPEYKKAIVRVKKYFERTKDDSEEQDCTSVSMPANALEVGVTTVKRIMADYNRSPDLLEKQSHRRGHPPKIIADFLQAILLSYIRQANLEGRHISLEMLSDYLKQQGAEQRFSIRTLGRTLDRWGFTFGKGTRSQHRSEKDHVIAAL